MGASYRTIDVLSSPHEARIWRSEIVDQEQVITTLEGMTVLELNALVKQLEERWGVSAAAPVAVGVAAGAAGGAAQPRLRKRSRPSSTSC